MGIDVKKWLADKSAELGLDQSEIAVAEKLVSAERFRSDFVPTSDFHSALDKQKNTYESKLNEVVNINRQWQDAYATEYAPAIEQVERLKKQGYDVSALQESQNRGEIITAADIQKMIDQRVEPLRAGTVDWSTFIADTSVDYRETYGKKFPVAEFRAFGFANREKYPTLESAYQAFTEKDRVAKEEKDREDWKAQERERIRIELQSNMSFPEGSGMENSPAFLATEQKTEVSDAENRKAFARQFADLKVTL